MKRKSIIISISSPSLTKEERSLIKAKKPWGIILFKRNIKNIFQIKELTSNIRSIMNDPFYPIILDQEGGKVDRLSNIINNSEFSQNYFGNLFERNRIFGIKSYKEYLNFTCQMLNEIGVNINTIPVLDVLKKKFS